MGPIVKSTFQTSFVLGLRLLIQAGTLLLVARMLGPSQFAAFAGIAALAVLLGTFSTFGTHILMLVEVSKDRTQRENILSYAVPTTLIMGSLIFLIYIFLCLLLFENFTLPLQIIFCIGFTEIVLLPVYLLATTEELALEKTAISQLLMIFPLALRAFAVTVVMIIDTNFPLEFYSWLYLVSGLLALGCMKLYKPNSWLKFGQWRFAKKREIKNSSGYAILALTAAGPGELDKMLAVKILSVGAGGLYIAASRVIGAATLPVTALLLSLLPRLFRDGKISLQRSRQLNNLILSCVFVYSVTLAALIWSIAPWVEWLFGHKYQGMTEMLQWLCFSVPALSLRLSIVSMLMTMERPWLRVGVEILGMFVLIINAIIFYPIFGVIGMALALALAEWLMVLIGYLIVLKLQISP